MTFLENHEYYVKITYFSIITFYEKGYPNLSIGVILGYGVEDTKYWNSK